MSVLNQVKPADIARYVFMPRIVPRVRELVSSGFGWIAYMMAYVYAGVRLLPPNHPYLQQKNFGRFGIRHVIAEAANRLEFRRDNLDQIAVFFALLTGFALLFLQFAILILSFIWHPALAADLPAAAGASSSSFQGFFKTTNPNDDIAFELLDKVFGIPGMFGSKYDPAGGGISGMAGNGIPGFTQGLQKLIKFYNTAMLIVGVAIFLYYIVLVVAETANTGTPFGRRFSHIYAPLRLVVAVGLLVPLNYGFNSAQYITLFAAKFGSSLATNTWLLFNKTVQDQGGNNPLAAPGETLLARPQMPTVGDTVSFMSLVKACANGYKIEYTQPPYAQNMTSGEANGSGSSPSNGAASTETVDVEPYLIYGGTQQASLISTSYDDAIGASKFNGRDITIRFGHYSQAMFPNQAGYVMPYCGEITIPISDVTQTGPKEVQQAYYQMIKDLWNNAELDQFAKRATALYLIRDPNAGHGEKVAVSATGGEANGSGSSPAASNTGSGSGASDSSNGLPGEAVRNQIFVMEDQMIQSAVIKARDDMAKEDFSITDDIKARGWGGAAIWYNRIAMWNGAYFGAVFHTPQPSAMPYIMARVEDERKVNNESVDSDNRYSPYMANNRTVAIQAGEEDLARMMNAIYQYWEKDTPGARTNQRPTGVQLMDVINRIFPYNALLEIRYNVDIHPLAQLVGLGKSIIDSSLRNLTIGLAFAAGGGVLKGMQFGMGDMAGFLSGAWIAITTAALAIGFTLYYVLPFMPFIYFFFAVGGWVKSIFEAMVGVPLWALAHLRIEGDGLPGDRAIEGYFLIFEIFLRPVLILFGLLGGLLIFAAMARTLHDVFGLLTTNTGGIDAGALTGNVTGNASGSFSPGAASGSDSVNGADVAAAIKANHGNALDEFFFTVIYTIILYSMGLSSFKLIDMLPATILRWMGSGASSFANSVSEPAHELMSYVAVGDQIINQQVIGGLEEGAMAGGGALGGAARGLFGRNAAPQVPGAAAPPQKAV